MAGKRSQPDPLQRDVDPYALVHRWGWWYGIGYCHLRGAIRTFRVDRIIELTLLDQTFDVPADFDIQEYLAAEPYTQPQVQVRMRFAPEAALMALDDRALWDTVEEQPDGTVVVTFAVPSLEWAARVALSYGPEVLVLEPDELRLTSFCYTKTRTRDGRPSRDQATTSTNGSSLPTNHKSFLKEC